ncbi:NADPH-dependent FMN reductase [Propionivibrio sp.]|uniref:NADPH-dependent FMN reductase n=1 Tax=Propionivibrio sp. TaxID=2212460 RepID=UPI003BF3F9BB
MKTRLLAISGSSRKDSVNKRLLDAAVAIARKQGAEVTVLDLRALALPLYDGDLEAASGLPEGAVRLKQAIREHHALLVASPEYNGFFTPLLKNAIDWATRPQEGFSSPFTGKTAALLAASPGALGGIRGLPALRVLLSGIGVLVTPGQMSLPLAQQAFDEQGALLNAQQHKMLEGVVSELLRTTLASASY